MRAAEAHKRFSVVATTLNRYVDTHFRGAVLTV